VASRRTKKPADAAVPVDRARDVLADPEAARRLLAQAKKKADHLGKKLPKQALQQLALLRRMVVAYVKGEYRQFPLRSILLAVGALLYFVNPFDLIPDFVVGFGLLDDATVIAFVLNSIQRDVAAFKKWEGAKTSPKKRSAAKAAKRPGSRRRSPTAA